MPATVTLTRHVGSFLPELRRGRFAVAVDGQDVGALENGETFEVAVAPGRHALRLHKGRYSSRPFAFAVADSDTVTLRCHGARVWPRWLLSFLVPSLAISVRPE
ncbi:MAG: hypothetical protein ACRDY1_14885 [Acidimicrobiales bacterium]